MHVASIICILFLLTNALKLSWEYPSDGIETECVCVPPHLCLDDDLSANGQDSLDIRFEDDGCPNYYDVCCEMPIEPTTIRETCGLSKAPQITSRITKNSNVAEFGELPWSVLVLRKNIKTSKHTFICGGSLIHRQVVLTAAHCVAGSLKNHQIDIRAGELNLKHTEEPQPHQEVPVKEVVLHPKYKPGSLWNDVALLFLETAVNSSDNVGVICLPPMGAKMDGIRCLASGWGRNTLNKSRHSSFLRKVEVPVIGRDQCTRALRSTKLGPKFHLHRSFLCAGGEANKDACKGDGGSPLVCPVPGHQGKFVQIGIVSWGVGCGGDGTPGVYVNLALFIEWIDRQILMKHLDTSVYKYK